MKKIIMMSLLALASLGAYAQSADKAVCKKFPNAPANATPVWPSTAYTPTQDPSCAPCYEYTTRSGLKVMECPYLWFPPENGNTSNAAAPVPVRTTQADDRGNMEVHSQNTYTGNYPICRKDGMPANAQPAFPTSAYTQIDRSCAPCYEYTTKRGLKVMECPNAWFPPEQ